MPNSLYTVRNKKAALERLSDIEKDFALLRDKCVPSDTDCTALSLTADTDCMQIETPSSIMSFPLYKQKILHIPNI